MSAAIAMVLVADLLVPGARPGFAPRVPSWVYAGTMAATGDAGSRFFGVGAVAGIKRASIRRKAADGKARDELRSLIKRFDASVAADATVAASLDAEAEKAIARAAILDHFIDNDGTEFALIALDLKEWKASVTAALDAAARDRVRAAADAAFAKLSAPPARSDR